MTDSSAAMFPIRAASKRIIKVSLGSDLRRLTLDLAPGTTADEAMAIIYSSVKRTFDLPGGEEVGLVLRYKDDEGDLCRLNAFTLPDLATLSGEGPWRLQAEKAAPTPQPQAQPQSAAAAATSGKDGEAEPAASGAGPDGAAHAEEGAAEGAGEGQPAGADDMTVAMVMAFLPMAAAAAQSPPAQEKLNRAGAEERDSVLPLCTTVLGHLDTLPETARLRPAAEAYINGSDVNNFGRFVAELLMAWSSSTNPEAVKAILKTLHGELMSVAAHFLPFGPWAKGKGHKGKGKGFKGFKGGKSQFKGEGKGMQADSSEQTAPMPDLGPLFQGLFGGKFGPKGFGKGWGAAAAAPANEAASSGAAAAEGASAAAAAAAAGQQDEFNQQVDDLLDMGLVTDREVARDLLRMHNGDISEVVAALAG